MEKTGESYQTALHYVKAQESRAVAPRADDPAIRGLDAGELEVRSDSRGGFPQFGEAA